MGDQSKKQVIGEQSAKLKNLLGPPPVLSSENKEAYDEIMALFLESFSPQDFFGQLLIKQLTDCTFEENRYTRHKALAIERGFRKQLELETKRTKATAERRTELAHRLANQTGKPLNEIERMLELEDLVGSTPYDMKEIFNRTAEELDHARALEESIEYQERLDKLRSTARALRNDILVQFERYSEGLDQRLRRVSNEIIETAVTNTKVPLEQLGPPLVPAAEELKDAEVEPAQIDWQPTQIEAPPAQTPDRFHDSVPQPMQVELPIDQSTEPKQ